MQQQFSLDFCEVSKRLKIILRCIPPVTALKSSIQLTSFIVLCVCETIFQRSYSNAAVKFHMILCYTILHLNGRDRSINCQVGHKTFLDRRYMNITHNKTYFYRIRKHLSNSSTLNCVSAQYFKPQQFVVFLL